VIAECYTGSLVGRKPAVSEIADISRRPTPRSVVLWNHQNRHPSAIDKISVLEDQTYLLEA
jgi:hypothetical protein